MSEELDPQTPVTDDDVEGHGIEEDDGDDNAEMNSLTLTGICV